MIRKNEMLKYNYHWWLIIISFFSTWGICNSLRVEDNRYISNSIYSIMIYLGVFFVLRAFRNIITKRLLVFSGISGIFYTLASYFGKQIYLYEGVGWSDITTYMYILFLYPFFVSCIGLLLYYVPIILRWICEYPVKNKYKKYFTGNVKYFLIVWLVLFVCWLPGFIATFPGIYAYDSVYQTKALITEGYLNNHHPILHSIVYCGCLMFGKEVLGSYESGMSIYIIFQMLILSMSMALVSKFLAKQKYPILLQAIFIIWNGIYPVNHLMAYAGTKDTLFSAFFMLWVLQSVRFVLDTDTFFSKRKNIIFYIVIIFLMAAFRNNGWYVFLFSIPAMFVVGRLYWKRIVLICMACCLCWGIYTRPVFRWLHVVPGDIHEMMSVPASQLTRAILVNEEYLTEEEKQMISEYVPQYSNYRPRLADDVKNTFNSKLLRQDPVRFIELWIGVGNKCLGTYIDAFLNLNIGYWYPDMIYRDPGAWHPYLEYANSSADDPSWIVLERANLFPLLAKCYNKFAYDTSYQQIPVVSLLFNPGMSVWFIVFVAVAIGYYKQWKFIFPCWIVLGLLGTLLLGPVVLVRYAYPIMVSVPVFFALLFQIENKDTDIFTKK